MDVLKVKNKGGSVLLEDKEYFKFYRNATKQLEAIGFPDSSNIAMYLADVNKGNLELNQEEIETAKSIMNVAGFVSTDENVAHAAIANSIHLGKKRIEDMYSFLRTKGYSAEEIKKFYYRHSNAFYYDAEEMNDDYEYLKSINLSEDHIRKVFLKAVCVGNGPLKERCECVLNYYDTETLFKLAQGYLFYTYYTDPVDGINYVIQELGAEKAQELLREEEMFLYLWKEKWQRGDWVHGKQHNEALEIIEKYKKSSLE